MNTNEGQHGLTDSAILTDAHRYCCKYVHADDAPYRFTERGIIEFVNLRIARHLYSKQADQLTARTADAVRELVDGLRALDDLRGIFGEPNPAKVKAAWEKCSALLAKYAPSQEDL